MGNLKVISFDFDRFLRNDPDAIQAACGMPYVSGTFVNHPRYFWSTPLAHYLGMIQKTEYDIALQAAKQRRVNILKFITAKNFMSKDKMNQLLSADVGAIAEADTTDVGSDKIMAFPQGSNLEFSLMSRENRQDAREAVGFTNGRV
jgi:hypothetical protein